MEAVCSNHPDARATARVDSMWLCTPCFLRHAEARAKAAIVRHGMVAKGDGVAVALSGGKDSSVLLLILKRIAPRLGVARLVAITVDEGISGYREEAISMAGDLARRSGVEHNVVRLKDLFGLTVDELSAMGGNSCTSCGVLRRRALDIVARARGCDVMATGHTREDSAETVLMNIFRGEPQRLSRTGPRTRRIEGFVPRIKPLYCLSEREVTLYAYLSGIQFQTRTCPYRTGALRLQVLTMLKRMEVQEEGAPLALIRALDRAAPCLAKRYGQRSLGHCQRCGYPSISGMCMACRVITRSPRA
jgi:uncharacterized protein (TIGR00269 family)